MQVHTFLSTPKGTFNSYTVVIIYSYFRILEHWDLGFEFHSRHGCLRALLCVLLCCTGGWVPCVGLIAVQQVAPNA
jgi:hypothetical protein